MNPLVAQITGPPKPENVKKEEFKKKVLLSNPIASNQSKDDKTQHETQKLARIPLTEKPKSKKFNDKTKPPMHKKLPSFLVAATVFSYLDYAYDIYSLLNLLNKNSQTYAVAHTKSLDFFLLLPPKISRTFEFGNVASPWEL